MNNKVVLVHGYNKSQKDMQVLKDNLEELGYQGILVDLPLTFKEIEECNLIFQEKMKRIITDLGTNEQVNLVGHSTGGLIIRSFLATTIDKAKINRAVLIATPNQGSQLADLAAKLASGVVNIFKTLKSLQVAQVEELELDKGKTIEVGAIAGNKSNLLLGNFLDQENDGRVQVNAVQYEGLTDFIILPYGHKEIHYQFQTAKLVVAFLEEGEF